MNHSLKFLLAGAVLLALAGPAHAEAAKTVAAPNHHDVVRDSSGRPVHTASGDCVRTQWLNSYDACDTAGPATASIPREERTVYFGFGKSTLTPEGKKTLDALAEKLKARKVAGVRVAGFADRIGNAAKNEKLSKKRADAVRKYLVSKGVVNAQVVETRWFGDSVPSADCPKKLKKAALIKCLQPDRRVEVEIDFAK